MARTAKKRASGGSVFKGVFIGLLFGLIIAAVLAFYVNRAPVPFVDRVGRQAPIQERVTSDPNRALYGGTVPDSAHSVPQAPVPPSADPLGEFLAKADLAPAPPPTSVPTPRIGTSPPSVGVTPPSASIAAVAPTLPSASTSAGATASAIAGSAGPTVYWLQAGAFRGQAEADALRAKLAMMGYEARVESTQVGSGTLHRVRLGPFAQLDDTHRYRSNLAGQGIETAIIRR